MIRKNKILFLILLAFINSCASSLPIRKTNQYKVLQYFESELKATDDVNRQFHVSASAELEVPGYIIGVEKAYKNILGVPVNRQSWKPEIGQNFWGVCSKDDKYQIYDTKYNEGIFHKILYDRLKGNRQITYVSHINKYSYSILNDPSSNTVNEYIYNSYGCHIDADKPICQHLSFRKQHYEDLCSHQSGWQAVINLKKRISQDLQIAKKSGKPYSHIIVYSMGWNTTQREAIQNFNYLQGNLIRLAKRRPNFEKFHPLFIGITWPSDWAIEKGEGGILDNVIRPSRRMASFFTKMNDADETGAVWGNILLHETLLPLKETNKNLKIVLIGHSFGNRVITNAVFGYPLISGKKWEGQKVDLLIGLQPAFSANRFTDESENEGHSYKNLSKIVGKAIYTWSKYDYANQIVPDYLGSESAYKNITSKNPKIFDFARTDNDGNYIKQPQNNPNKVLDVDLSNVLNHQPNDGSGGAHSDIYQDAVTGFILNNIKLYAD